MDLTKVNGGCKCGESARIAFYELNPFIGGTLDKVDKEKRDFVQ